MNNPKAEAAPDHIIFNTIAAIRTADYFAHREFRPRLEKTNKKSPAAQYSSRAKPEDENASQSKTFIRIYYFYPITTKIGISISNSRIMKSTILETNKTNMVLETGSLMLKPALAKLEESYNDLPEFSRNLSTRRS
ncbi:MAG: hypothetical protein R3C24_07385 [Cyanobacteriota/Melainabacteria group bacterium]